MGGAGSRLRFRRDGRSAVPLLPLAGAGDGAGAGGRHTSDLLGLLPAVLFVLLFSLLPLAAVALQAWGFGHGVRGLVLVLRGGGVLGRAVRDGLRNSLLQGTLSAALALLWGAPVGAFLGRHRFPGRDVLLAFLLVPFLLPVLVVVLGFQELFGMSPTGQATGFLTGVWPSLGWLSSGLPAIVTVNVFYNTTMVALFTVAGVGQASPSLEAAVATLGGGSWRRFRDVWGRPALLGAFTGTLLTFLFSFLSFAPPLLLGQGYSNYTIENWIYFLFVYRSSTLPLGVSLAVSLWTMLLLLLPSALYVLLARKLRLFSAGSSSSRELPRALSRGWLPQLPFLGATLLLVGFVSLMLGALLVGSFVVSPGGSISTAQLGWANWQLLFSDRVTQTMMGTSTLTALGNTLFFALVSTLLLLLVGLAAGFAKVHHPRTGFAVDVLSFVPLLASPVILALALWTFFASTLDTPTWLWVLIVGAQAGLALPFVLQTMTTAFRANSPRPREAAQLLGAGRLRAFLDADVPMARGALVTAALFAFALSLGEFTATNFLYVPAYATLTVEMYQLELARFPAQPVQALGAVLVLVSLVSFYTILGIGRRSNDRR